MTEASPAPFTVAELRMLRDRTRALPAAPWAAVEMSHLELHGPAPFDADIDEQAWRANERHRAETAAWRGIRAADGTRILGEPLAGGRPLPVYSAELLWLAEARTAVPRLLATLRSLWPGSSPPADQTQQATVTPRPQARIEEAARAAYDREPGIERWDQLTAGQRRSWVARIEAALDVLQDPSR